EKAPGPIIAPPEPPTSAPVSAPANGNARPARIVPTKILVRREQKGEQVQLDAKKQDIQFFMKRFPKAVHTQAENGDTIIFNYKITDPDWVFDVRTIKFGIKLEANYPIDMPVIMVPKENIALPDILKSHLEAGCNEALKTNYANFESKNAFEPIGKIFVRWLDRNIFDLFVAGLKKTKLVQEAEAAGIRLVVPNPEAEQPQKEEEEEAPAANLPDDPDKTASEVDDLANLHLYDKEPNQGDNVDQNSTTAAQQSTPEIEVALVWRDSSHYIAQTAATYIVNHEQIFSAETSPLSPQFRSISVVNACDVDKNMIIPYQLMTIQSDGVANAANLLRA
ncbi:unnamed protein product, partial [Cylicostephanus goldi]